MSNLKPKTIEEIVEKGTNLTECLKEFLPHINSEQDELKKLIVRVEAIEDFDELMKPFRRLLNKFDATEDFFKTPFEMEGQLNAFKFFAQNSVSDCYEALKKNKKQIDELEEKLISIGQKMIDVDPNNLGIKEYKNAINYRYEFMIGNIDYYSLYGFHYGLKWCFGLCDDLQLLNL